MNWNINEISLKELGIEQHALLFELAKKNDILSDETLSWAIELPPFYASAMDDELKKRIKEEAEQFHKNKPENIKIVKLIKKEFYNFVCTDSEKYKKERGVLLNENINTVIGIVANAIAVTMPNNTKAVIIMPIVTMLIVAVGKMGKNVACAYFNPESNNV